MHYWKYFVFQYSLFSPTAGALFVESSTGDGASTNPVQELFEHPAAQFLKEQDVASG